MNPYHVKRIHQLPASRIRGMVGISKLPLIDHHARLGVRRDIIKPSRHGAWLVHLRQKSRNRLLYSIRPAERPDYPVLLQRVRLLLYFPLHHCLLAAAHRPLRRIPPVFVTGQYCIRVQDFPLNIPEHKLPVRRSRRPVHQATRLISGIVKQLYADILRHLPRRCRILIRRYRPGQRDNQPEPGILRRVLMGGIDKAAEIK